MIIALTGEKLAGKGTVAEYLVHRHSAQTFRFSQPLSDIARRLFLENSRANLVKLGTMIRQSFGDNILAQAIKHDVSNSTAELKVIDGMRYMSEYDLLKDLPDFHLIYITAPVITRYQRTRQRSEKQDEAQMSEAEFKQREHDVTEREIHRLSILAEVTIYNTGTMQELYDKIDLLPLAPFSF